MWISKIKRSCWGVVLSLLIVFAYFPIHISEAASTSKASDDFSLSTNSIKNDYDASGRLQHTNWLQGKMEYEYDSNGNTLGRKRSEPKNRIESDSSAVTQSGIWFNEGGVNVVSNTAGSKLIVKFTGDAIKMNAVAGPNRGIANIRIDGKAYPDIDMYDTNYTNKSYGLAYNLDSGSHTLEVTVSGNKRFDSAGTYLVVDAFLIFGQPEQIMEPGNRVESDNRVVIQSGDWFNEGGVNLASSVTGSKLVMKFTGDSIKMNAAAGPNRGIANIRINGQSYPDIDLYDTEYKNRDYLIAYGLGDGPHVLEVTVLGNKRAESTGVFLVVDAFFVSDQPQAMIEPSTRIESDNSFVIQSGNWSSEGGINLISNAMGSKLMVEFMGDSVKMNAVAGPNRGIANIRIDGQSYPDIDLFDTEYRNKDYIIAYGLGSGPHILEVTVSGNKRAEATAAYLVIDAFLTSDQAQTIIEPEIRIESDNSKVIQSGNWSSEGGINVISNAAGSKLVLKFTGDAVKMNAAVGPNRGIANIRIDGKHYFDFDLYDREYRNLVYTIAYGLGEGPHTLEVTVSGNKRSESTDSFLAIAIFFIKGEAQSLIEPGTRTESDNRSVLPSGNWFSEGGINIASNETGSKLVLKFTGDAVKMNAVAGPNRGIAHVQIDGNSYSDIDLYDIEFRNKEYTIAYGLGNGPHTLEITVSGNKRLESSNTYLVVHAFFSFEPSNRIESDNGFVIQSGNWFSEGGINLSSNSMGSKLVVKFTGDAVKMNAVAGPNRGIAGIRIDGQPYPDIDLYDTEFRNRDYRIAYGLDHGSHVLEVNVSGNKRAESTDTYLVVDTFLVFGEVKPLQEPGNRIESDNALVIQSGNWFSEGGVNLASDSTGSKLVLKFTGDAVKMNAVAGPNRGIANIRIDGRPYPDIDLYDSSYERRDYTLAYGLGDGVHTMEVSVSGNKRLESTDNFVVIDAFFVPGN